MAETYAELRNPKREHPHRARWLEDEARQRASFLATRRHLAPFLVPHRFEGDLKGEQLRRAKYGYGLRLNASYVGEIIGHLTAAPVTRDWTALGGEADHQGPPAAGLAAELWADATGDGETWEQFLVGPGGVLEWMLSSPGCLLVWDVPPIPTMTRADEVAAGKRPYCRLVPWSAVEDFGRDATGFRWLKFTETGDGREPDADTDGELPTYHVLYWKDPAGQSHAARFDQNGKRVGNQVDLGVILDTQGRPSLPVVEARYGKHPDIPSVLGTGLLLGLEDIILDLFNILSETREGFRDAAFGMWWHKGPDGEKVADQFQEGTRLVLLGDSDTAAIGREGADPAEAQTGMQLLELGLKAWAEAAARQAAEAVSAREQSGVALKAEFQLDLRPLLVRVAGRLDEVETNALWVAAQLGGATAQVANGVTVARGTEFQLEDEASRISRLVGEFVRSLPLPREGKVQLFLRWARASKLFDLDGPVDPDAEAGAGGTLGDVMEAQVREQLDQEAEAERRKSTFDFGALTGARF